MLRRKKRKESKAESFILISYGFSFSLPIFVFSLSFIIGQLIDFEKSEISLGNLKEVKDGSSIFTALLFSFVSFVSLVHHHNEKKTDAVISLFVSGPFTLITIFSRSICLSIIAVHGYQLLLTTLFTIVTLNSLVECHNLSNHLRRSNCRSKALPKLCCCFPSVKFQEELLFYSRYNINNIYQEIQKYFLSDILLSFV